MWPVHDAVAITRQGLLGLPHLLLLRQAGDGLQPGQPGAQPAQAKQANHINQINYQSNQVSPKHYSHSRKFIVIRYSSWYSIKYYITKNQW